MTPPQTEGCLGPLEALEALTSLDQRLLSAVCGGGTTTLTLPQHSRPVTGRRQSIAIGCSPALYGGYHMQRFRIDIAAPSNIENRPCFLPRTARKRTTGISTRNTPFFAGTPCLCGTRKRLIRIRLIASERLTVPAAAPFIDERAGEKTEQKKWGGAPCDVSILRSVRLRGC